MRNARDHESCRQLVEAGVDSIDALALRRISMTLHRWHELECGSSDNYKSWCLTRGVLKNGKEFHHDEDGLPFMEIHYHDRNGAVYNRVGDREKNALMRLKAIMTKYPAMGYYIQGDPRGASLYIFRPGDIPDGEKADSMYTRGIAVYK
jgi:hypothetical protein